MSAAEPPQGANSAPSGGSAAAQPQAWGDHRHMLKFASPLIDEATIAGVADVLRSGQIRAARGSHASSRRFRNFAKAARCA